MTSPGSGAQRSQDERSQDDPGEHRIDGHGTGSQPDAAAHPLEAERVLRALALSAVEIIAGARDLEQLARWVTDDVYAHLGVRVSIAARARSITGIVAQRPILWIDHVTMSPTATGGFDAVILVHDKRRPHVVALQVEGLPQHWRATVLVVM
ncbi:Rv3235 family protein [Cryobacterium sp. PH31-O1]|uniref:Rv3235 family protein n=1 Tax=Cryobacterium sp. PH31-O1 TaxID=3046306 RepID=UPI0024BB6AD2|nr:Rv3235 family protein [Cryobacterium sp. PH31-O1]MDJ0339084.1 Rv3235 family protein [Cryobacterium sp. PH31-O1]